MKLNRRDLLRGIGAGAFLLAPFTGQRVIRAQAAAQAGNLLVFHTPNGFLREKFGAQGSGQAFQLLSSLEPLTPFKNDLAVIRGLCCKSTSEKSSHEDISRILTCTGDGPDGSDPGAGGTFIAEAYGPSIDHHVATELGLPGPLTLGVEPTFGNPTDWNDRLAWRKDGDLVSQVSAVTDPRAVYDDLFSGFMPTGMPAPVDRSQDEGQSVINAIREDIELMRPRLSSSDRGQLDAYVGQLAELEAKIAGLPPAVSASCDPEQLGARADLSTAAGDAEQLQANGEIMMDMIASSFACGIKRTATMQWQRASLGINPIGGPDHHEVSHGAGNREETLPLIDAWYAERIAYQLNQLKQVGILDNTIVVWLSEISEDHNQNDMVVVVAGGKNLGLKLGQYIEYPYEGGNGLRDVGRQPGNKNLADLWVTVQNAMGVASPIFGEPGVCGGPLLELRSS